MSFLYRDFKSQLEIDEQYDVEKSVPDFGVYANHYVGESQYARDHIPCHLDVPYGPTLDETLDIFPSTEPGAPVFVFIHGGYWKSLTSKEFSCVAKGPQQAGFTTVVVNYSLCPKVDLNEISRQARAAVAWVLRNIEKYGGDSKRIIVGGHSAGAHLTAMCLQTDWAGEYGLPADPLAGALMVSGLFDLRPIRWSLVQPKLQLNEDLIQRNSPLFHVRRATTPLFVSWGANEPGEFRRQSEDFAIALRAAGSEVRTWCQPDRNHFDAIYELEDSKSTLLKWMTQAGQT